MLFEFHKAWEFLGLEGTADEVDKAFDGVDTDKSGKIDRREFTWAISSARLPELSMNVIMEQMGGQLEGLEDIFSDYKRKLEESRKAALENMKNSEGKFLDFQATAQRRRVLKKKYEEEVATQMRAIVRKLRVLNGETLAEEEDEGYQFYNTLVRMKREEN